MRCFPTATAATGHDRRRVGASRCPLRQTVALAVAALVVAAGCSEGVPAIDTGPAENALNRTVAASGFPDDGTLIALDSCPIPDVDLLIDQIFGDLGGDVDAAIDAPTQAFVSAPGERADADAHLGCGKVDPASGTGVALLIADAPGDGLVDPAEAAPEFDVEAQWDGVADDYAMRFGDVETDLDSRRIDDTRGGTMYVICIAEPDVPTRDSCEAAWFGGDLVVSALVTGPASSAVDTQTLEQEHRRRLQLVVDGLASN